MVIGHVFKIESLKDGKSHIGKSTHMETQIKKFFNSNGFTPDDWMIKVLYTSASTSKETVRQEFNVQYRRFKKQCDEEIGKRYPQPKVPKEDGRIGKESPHSKKVIRVDDEGIPKAIFTSVTDASRITGCSKSSISAVCNGNIPVVERKDKNGVTTIYKFQWI